MAILMGLMNTGNVKNIVEDMGLTAKSSHTLDSNPLALLNMRYGYYVVNIVGSKNGHVDDERFVAYDAEGGQLIDNYQGNKIVTVGESDRISEEMALRCLTKIFSGATSVQMFGVYEMTSHDIIKTGNIDDIDAIYDNPLKNKKRGRPNKTEMINEIDEINGQLKQAKIINGQLKKNMRRRARRGLKRLKNSLPIANIYTAAKLKQRDETTPIF